MARKISEIYDRLNSSKATFQELHDYVVDCDNTHSLQDNWETLLADITSGSRVAVWRLWLWIFSVGSWIVESLFDAHRSEITTLLSAKKPHTLRWYAEESKKYQYGYAMEWIGDTWVYDQLDESSRIIKYAAASEKDGKVKLKVAKEVGGVKTPLNVTEKATFTEFWRQWKDAGVKVEIVSQAADILKVNLTIVRDRLVLNGDNTLLRDANVNPITNAINAYAGNLEFDGVIMLSHLVDAIQAAEGVIDVKLNSAQHKPAGGTYSTVDMKVEAVAGYFIIAQESTCVYQDNVIVAIE